jgi:hypothetical protein
MSEQEILDTMRANAMQEPDAFDAWLTKESAAIASVITTQSTS